MQKRATFIIQTFQQLEVTLNPASRLAQQVDVFLDRKQILPRFIEPDHPLFQVAIEAHRDLSQITFSLNELLPFVPRKELKTRLRRLVQDNVLPQDSPTRSPGRDAQCELFVAALCAKAQLQPVFDESPDIRCILAKQALGVAVKRIKSPPEHFDDRFEQRMREAAEQVEKSGVPGIIVTDVSQSLNPTNWRIPIQVSDSEFDAAWRAEMVRLKTRFEKPLQEWTRGRNVRGVILIDHKIRCSPMKVWQMELYSSPLNLSVVNQRRRREFELFYDHF